VQSSEEAAVSKGMASYAVDSEGHMQSPNTNDDQALDDTVTDDFALLQTDVETFKELPLQDVSSEEEDLMDSTPILLLQDNLDLFHSEVVDA